MSELKELKSHHQSLNPEPSISVLVIDDQPIIVESIRRLLASETDIEVHTCNDPMLALSIASELRPSVILQALAMRDADGLMLVKFLRAHPLIKDVPIIVLSSTDESQTQAAAFQSGANDYLIKLPDPIELIARLRYHAKAYSNLLKRNEAEQALLQNKVLKARVEERTKELKQALIDLKQAQTKLTQNEKMSSMGQLVAGIAQEVNKPISFIYGNLNDMNSYIKDLLDLIKTYQEQYPQPNSIIHNKLEKLDLEFTSKDLLESFISLQSGVQRIRDLVLSLKNFSRFNESELKTVDIREGLESTLALLGDQLAGVTIEKDYSNLPKISCYASQLNQVFMHIISNALQAIKASDALKSEQTKSPMLHLSTSAIDEHKIAIWIADNGPGISPEIQDRIYEPFFTTQAASAGTGLGLSISHQIVTVQHGGRLKCYSVPGQGAKFLIELPVTAHQAIDDQPSNQKINTHHLAASEHPSEHPSDRSSERLSDRPSDRPSAPRLATV